MCQDASLPANVCQFPQPSRRSQPAAHPAQRRPGSSRQAHGRPWGPRSPGPAGQTVAGQGPEPGRRGAERRYLGRTERAGPAAGRPPGRALRHRGGSGHPAVKEAPRSPAPAGRALREARSARGRGGRSRSLRPPFIQSSARCAAPPPPAPPCRPPVTRATRPPLPAAPLPLAPPTSAVGLALLRGAGLTWPLGGGPGGKVLSCPVPQSRRRPVCLDTSAAAAARPLGSLSFYRFGELR